MQALVNLVSTTTSDNLQLKGLYAKANSKNPAIIFVHGFQSSIYSHKFVEDSLDVAVNCNHSFLLA